MAKSMVKCPICNSQFDRNAEETVQYGARRWAHKTCAIKENSRRAKEEIDRRNLEEYIKKLFGIPQLDIRIHKQISGMMAKFNFSYSGILKTLIYFYDVQGNTTEKSNGGIGIVPYVYKDAFNYYKNLHDAQKRNEEKVISDYVSTGRIVSIQSPIVRPKQKRLFKLEED